MVKREKTNYIKIIRYRNNSEFVIFSFYYFIYLCSTRVSEFGTSFGVLHKSNIRLPENRKFQI